jgi:hypothetical protein
MAKRTVIDYQMALLSLSDVCWRLHDPRNKLGTIASSLGLCCIGSFTPVKYHIRLLEKDLSHCEGCMLEAPNEAMKKAVLLLALLPCRRVVGSFCCDNLAAAAPHCQQGGAYRQSTNRDISHMVTFHLTHCHDPPLIMGYISH